MESFFRYIAYIDHYEKGLRLGNVGYLRWRMNENKHQLEIEIRECGSVTGNYKITEESTGAELAVIPLTRGQGSLRVNREALEKDGGLWMKGEAGEMDLFTVCAFRIAIDRDHFLRIPLELPLTQRTEKKELKMIREEKKRKEETGGKPDLEKEENDKEDEPVKEEIKPQEEKIAPPLEEDKWQQLCRSYPQVHPFSDGKTFLSIKPEDFIILQESCQKLVHNSFLLHGYYNYRHMILGKLAEGEDQPYYIGVPGVFYEKEKQAAGLFGFAGFEGVEYPVRNGSQGYYMIEVRL